MKMKMRTALLLVVMPSATSDSRAIDASAIQALDEQSSAAAARNDLEGTVAFYADDAVLLPPNAPIAHRSEVDKGILGGPARSQHGRVLEGRV